MSKSEKNIKAFYRNIKNRTTLPSPSDEEITLLIQSCRHGFAHKFFPKHDIGVDYMDYSNTLFDTANGYTLNTYALIRQITEGLSYLISRTDLHPTMQQCLHNYINHAENNIPVKFTLFQKIKNLFLLKWLKK